MQLSSIKISGFKSFVDPTTINLPGRRIAIVGPNGCGKSNIIDAVTWVMGESSPKYLRGESLTDVIFNGSVARKPIGQASVELIFDNSDGSIGGEYAKYAEIAVKRQINRESDSTYYLNGVRCRKRDISDIFLGTGLGPRSYSIIGQNMINKIIDAKPEELRGYLEEAAGISKYKERRHETELRIGHTKDNLARVYDLRNELETQSAHLKHQANVAEKFKSFKQQERILRSELYTIQWRDLHTKISEYQLEISRNETALESQQSQLIKVEQEIGHVRDSQRDAQEALQAVQKSFYGISNEITRIEQELVYHQEKKQQWEKDLSQSNHDWTFLKEQLAEAADLLREHETDIENLTPRLKAQKHKYTSLSTELATSEQRVNQWQSTWDEFHQEVAKLNQQTQVEKTRIEHLQQQITLLTNRKNQLAIDQDRYNFADLEHEMKTIEIQVNEENKKLTTQQSQLSGLRKQVDVLNAEQQDDQKQLFTLRNSIEKLNGQRASLEALQQTALGQRDNRTRDWIKKHNLTNELRLAQQIKVEKGWEYALEKILGNTLQAVCIEDINHVLPHTNEFKSGDLCLVARTKSTSNGTNKQGKNLLINKVTSDFPLTTLLANIYTAESVEEAQLICESLDEHESVITPDGLWFSKAWLKILREDDPATGVFQREQELIAIQQEIESLLNQQQQTEQVIANRLATIKSVERERDQLQPLLSSQQKQVAELQAQLKMKQARLLELQKESERFKLDYQNCIQQLDHAQNDLSIAKTAHDQALSALQRKNQSRDQLVKDRNDAITSLQNLRAEVGKHKELMHELEMRIQTSHSQKAGLEQNCARLEKQQAAIEARNQEINHQLANMQPIENIENNLKKYLAEHQASDVAVNKARLKVESLEQELKTLESTRQGFEKSLSQYRAQLENLRVDLQGWKVRSDAISEQIKEINFQLDDVLKTVPEDAVAEVWQTKVEQINNRINRLGPINLIAIEEYATCEERKQYIINQIEDLEAGLQTLEDAIAKIDKETKAKFKETFDKVNARFQELFPTVFGGGKAILELNSEDLLTAGVTMMACPPGKRNSSIHLLSGGEKSLTAIALIFSIFHLNPAPFCLLDEVDAALDDANVLRFTRLVKAMADKTQFLFISHNKMSIEMGEYLIGVTMNEPGVSRLVSVDIEKAMSLAEAS